MNKVWIYKKIKGINLVDFGEEVAVFNEDTGNYYVINEIGKDILRLVDGKKTVEDIVRELLLLYEVTEEKCYESVFRFLDDMSKEVLVNRVDQNV